VPGVKLQTHFLFVRSFPVFMFDTVGHHSEFARQKALHKQPRHKK